MMNGSIKNISLKKKRCRKNDDLSILLIFIPLDSLNNPDIFYFSLDENDILRSSIPVFT